MMEQELNQGATQGIVKINGHIHRPRNYWSPATEALLIHLEDVGFEYSPRFLGIDSNDRQILSYLDGVVGHYPAKAYMWSDGNLANAAEILRLFHDATVSFNWNDHDCWQFSCPEGHSEEVVCHNDFATYNCVYKNQVPVGMIDFDTCGPGSRVWDIAFTAFRFIPIASPRQQRQWGCKQPIDLSKRLELLLSSYGLSEECDVLKVIYDRLTAVRTHVAAEALEDSHNAKRIRDENHVESYDDSIAYFIQETGYQVR